MNNQSNKWVIVVFFGIGVILLTLIIARVISNRNDFNIESLAGLNSESDFADFESFDDIDMNGGSVIPTITATPEQISQSKSDIDALLKQVDSEITSMDSNADFKSFSDSEVE